MKFILLFLLLPLSVFGANPSFNSFDTGQFANNGIIISVKDGVNITNGNLNGISRIQPSSELRFESTAILTDSVGDTSIIPETRTLQTGSGTTLNWSSRTMLGPWNVTGALLADSAKFTNGITNLSLTASSLTYADANKKAASVTLGAGLDLTGGTLSLTGGSGGGIATLNGLGTNTTLTNFNYVLGTNSYTITNRTGDTFITNALNFTGTGTIRVGNTNRVMIIQDNSGPVQASYSLVIAPGTGGSSINVISNSTILGGATNTIVANSAYSHILGGLSNSINGNFSSLLGGRSNLVAGNYSVSAGLQAIAAHDNTFVWNGFGPSLASSSSNQFLVGASGGFSVNANLGNSLVYSNVALNINLSNNTAAIVDAMVVSNSVAATAANPKYSGALVVQGAAWNTSGTGASAPVQVKQSVQPLSASGGWKYNYSWDGYTNNTLVGNLATLNFQGDFTASTYSLASPGAGSTAGFFGGVGSHRLYILPTAFAMEDSSRNFTNLVVSEIIATNGIATYKGNGAAPVSITVGASPFTYTSTNRTKIEVYVGGGIVTALAKNGTTIATGLTVTGLSTVLLQTNETVTVTYTGTPLMNWYNF